MFCRKNSLLVLGFIFSSAFGVKVDFTGCDSHGWTCSNNKSDVVYNCAGAETDDVTIHLKDFYTGNFNSVTVKDCKDLKVAIDCPVLQRPSRLQHFRVKDCERLEFVTLSDRSLVQTPGELTIENVKEILSFPKGFCKSPINISEKMCMGSAQVIALTVKHSKINVVETKAIYNVSFIRAIELDNVTIDGLQTEAMDVICNNEHGEFIMNNCKIGKITPESIKLQTKSSISITSNIFGALDSNAFSMTAVDVKIIGNEFAEIGTNGLLIKADNIYITNNHILKLKTNGLSSIKCSKNGYKQALRRQFHFTQNQIDNTENQSLLFNYQSCKAARTTVLLSENKIDCTCQNIAYLAINTELNTLILNAQNNNTCLAAPCHLPVEVVKILKDSSMCQLHLDPQIVCLLYHDRKTTTVKEISLNEDITEAAATAYMVRQANNKGDQIAAFTVVDKDSLMKDTNMNTTNRKAVRIVFDPSRTFEDNLRSTENSRKNGQEKPQVTVKHTPTTCNGGPCRNTLAHDKQRALDFYKYIYAQLRPPRKNDNVNKT